MQDLRKLAWACRRGMLELDVLLGNFLKEAYPTLNKQDQVLFEKLLAFADPDLADWLLGQQKAPIEIATIVEKIRTHAKSRF